MPSERFRAGANVPIEAVMELGAVGVVYIRRKLDEKYLNAINEWDTPRVSKPMDLIVTTVDREFWEFNFDSTLGEDIDNYVLEPRNEAPTATQQPEVLFAYVGGYLNDLALAISKILGLSHENIVLDPLTYDDRKNPLTAKVRIYNSATNALNDLVGFGLTAKYLVVQEYNLDGTLSKFTQTLDES